VIAPEDMYGGTYRLFAQVLEPLNIKFSYADFADIQSIQEAFTPSTKMVWIETPTNPLLKIFDIALISALSHKKNALVVVDNTFATPFFQKPLNLGVDIVVHSTTKYINGHSDIIGGAVILNDPELYSKIKFYQNAIGAVPSPFDSWLTLRGIKTLAVRMQQHEKNASQVALLLQDHPKVEKVYFPGLANHVNHEIAVKQMTGFGGLVSFNIIGGLNEANKFFKGLKIFSLADSLGGVESLANYSTKMTHSGLPENLKKKIGITDNLIRLSIGIEHIDDLINDLDVALKNA
jgi:cystathionine beta-lyase/cystathionine gamma-synthase